MPKTLTGAELQLDDGPARDAELFLVDGNNLAYRAFFALPEELATTEGFPTNALLGFANMLFKLLSDYRPKGVAVAWDTRAVHRHELSEDYKSDRRPMPDLLGEQFPFFRPIVEAFGYRNLEFEGWEADDVIATLATRADEAGVRTCVVSTDRDAGQLVAEYGSLDGVLEHVDELSPARAKNIREHAEQALVSKELATMRRALDIDCDPAALVLAPPDRGQLKEMFRRFEFRNLLGRVDELDAALPARPMRVEGTEVDWREGTLEGLRLGRIGLAIEGGRFAVAN